MRSLARQTPLPTSLRAPRTLALQPHPAPERSDRERELDLGALAFVPVESGTEERFAEDGLPCAGPVLHAPVLVVCAGLVEPEGAHGALLRAAVVVVVFGHDLEFEIDAAVDVGEVYRLIPAEDAIVKLCGSTCFGTSTKSNCQIECMRTPLQQ